MSSHSEATIGPTNNLHRCCIGNQVHQVTPCLVQQSCLQESFFVMLLKYCQHFRPEFFLPLENSFLCYNIRRYVGFQATLEEMMSQISNVVQRVVIGDYGIDVIFQKPFIYDNVVLGLIFREKDSLKLSSSYHSISSTVFSTNSMTFEQNWILETKVHTLDVNSVSTNRDTFPPTSHRPVRAPPSFFQSKFLLLFCSRSNRWFFENRPEALSGCNRIMQYLIFRVISTFTAQIIKLPRGNVYIRFNPLF
mmetsp:Transcript_12382/g.16082  ORF Transcript_12382/g.16082 Transcript_12382/m.16082 type:complete len:249 (+) Transcript_12382:854-1600(+)